MSEDLHTNASKVSHGPEVHKTQPPAYLPPPFPPSNPMPLESGASSRPALPFMTPPLGLRSQAARMRRVEPAPARLDLGSIVASYTFFDAVIEGVQWGTTSKPQVFWGPDGIGHPIYVQPDRPIFLNYTVSKGFFQPSMEGVLIARVGDGLIAPAHQNITFSPQLSEIVGGVFQLGGWSNPFPASLYGHHQVILDLWAVTPNGQPLPPEYQTNPPDPRKFVLQSTDWAWLWVSPGCRGYYDGIDFCTIKSFSATPTQVMLDPTGNNFLPNQNVTATWEVDTLDLPPTQFGFKGSFTGVYINFWSGYLVSNSYSINATSGLRSGSHTFNLGGYQYIPPIWISISSGQGTTCGTPQASIPLSGVIPNKPPPPPTLADIVHIKSWISPGTIVHGGEPFVVYFECANLGGTATGPFKAHLQLDNGIQVADVDIPSMIPGSFQDIQWPFNSGLPSGDHWIYCYLDLPDNAVAESNKNNNTGYNGFMIY